MKIVILNDTRADAHHGCSRVMSVLENGLHQVGFDITATSPVRHKWSQDAAFLRALSQADAVVINGEGTLHHGKDSARMLLEVCAHPARRAAPVFLVNALYQDNPAEWGRYLQAMSGIWARDNKSAAALQQDSGLNVTGMLDLTLCAGPLPGAAARKGLVVGDSVSKPLAAQLAALARAEEAMFLPSTSRLKAPKGNNRVTRYLRDLYVARHTAKFRQKNPNLTFAATAEEYARYLGQAELHITGRFHGVCFSLLTETPFLTIKSNSWKTEALLEDIGLSPDRVCAPEDLPARIRSRDWGFDAQERQNLQQALTAASVRANTMFQTIRDATVSAAQTGQGAAN